MITRNINELVNALNNGLIGCFETDTIWGLSANPNTKQSLINLYNLKERDLDKPFIFLIKENQNLNDLIVKPNKLEQKLIDTFWPGPLTIIFNAKPNLNILENYKNKETIALRMPKNALVQNILKQLDYPLPSTSVNLAGQKPLNSFDKIVKQFNTDNFCILNLTTPSKLEIKSSTIVQVKSNKVEILREGTIKKEDIFKALA